MTRPNVTILLFAFAALTVAGLFGWLGGAAVADFRAQQPPRVACECRVVGP